MTQHHDLQLALDEQRKRRDAHAAAWARNFDRYTRRFERHRPLGPNRIARRAHLQPGASPAEPFSPEKQGTMIERLKNFFFPGAKPPRPPKSPTSQYVRLSADNPALLREVRNVDRRLLSEIRRAKRHQPKEPT
jgi:hypothetical protein